MSEKDPYSDKCLLKRNINDLLADNNEIRIGLFLANEYRDKLSEIETETYPQTCLQVSNRIKKGIESNKYSINNKTRYNAMLNVARSGLNDFYRKYFDIRTEKLTDNVELLILASELHFYCALATFKNHRPFDALDHIQYSIRHTSNVREYLRTKTDSVMESKIRVMDYMSRYTLMESAILTEIVGYVNKEFKKKIAYYIYNSQIVVSNYYSDEGMITESEEIANKAEAFRSNMLITELDLKDRDYHNILFSDKNPDINVYEEWCWGYYFCLNPMNDIPVLDDPDYKDTFRIETDEVNRIRLNDVLRTFDHSRRIMFWFYHLPKKERYDCKGEPIQRLLDCYFRLYSTLDKIAKLLYDLIVRGNYRIKPKDRYFANVAEYLEKSTNDYIKGISEISQDINYSNEDYEKGFVDPFYNLHRIPKRPRTIRNEIDHKALMLVNPEDDYEIKEGVLTISARDLEVETNKLMRQIRELLLNMELASRSGGLTNDIGDDE